jgi:hypothetical protein
MTKTAIKPLGTGAVQGADSEPGLFSAEMQAAFYPLR